MDSSAVRPGHWRTDLYNLCKLSYFLGAAFCFFAPKAAQRYMALTFHRQDFRLAYVRWFRAINNLLARKGIKEDFLKEDLRYIRWFGTYLTESVVDYFIAAIDSLIEENFIERHQEVQHEFAKLPKPLTDFLNKVLAYSDGFNESWTTMERRGKPSEVIDSAQPLYELVKRINGLGSVPFHDKLWLQEQMRHLNTEQEWFLKWLDADHAIPLVFVNKTECEKIGGMLKLLGEKLPKDSAEIRAWLTSLRNALVLFQRCQSEFLLHGLGRHGSRSREELLNRIANYALLFRSDSIGAYCDKMRAAVEQFERENGSTEQGSRSAANTSPRFSNWTAYDLFCYIRGLVPVEIQIRTQLASTMAEQYHNAVYKARPPKATAAQRRRMEEIGRELNELDKEMDVVVEDYVDHWLDEEEPLTPDGE
jgi:hypothetical protein